MRPTYSHIDGSPHGDLPFHVMWRACHERELSWAWALMSVSSRERGSLFGFVGRTERKSSSVHPLLLPMYVPFIFTCTCSTVVCDTTLDIIWKVSNTSNKFLRCIRVAIRLFGHRIALRNWIVTFYLQLLKSQLCQLGLVYCTWNPRLSRNTLTNCLPFILIFALKVILQKAFGRLKVLNLLVRSICIF